MAQDAGDRAVGRGKESGGGGCGARMRPLQCLCVGQGMARDGALGAWRRVASRQEAFAGGASRKLLLEELLEEGDPQKRGYHSSGWTVPLLKSELAKGDYVVSERTVRRTLKRLGFRWKRPKYVLGRPDPDYEHKKGK